MHIRSVLAASSLALFTPPAAPLWAHEAPKAAPAPVIPAPLGLDVQVAAAASKIVPGSPAEKAGFRISDRVLLLDGKPVADSTSFVKSIAALPPRQVVAVTVLRKGEELVVRATLDDYAEPAPVVDGKPVPRGRLGLGVDDLVVVANVSPGGLAEQAGVRRGDRIEEVNSHTVETISEASKKLAGTVYRGQAELKLRRNGETLTVTLNLGAPVAYEVTAADDQAAAMHFRELSTVYQEIAADPVEGSGKYIGETEFLSARVLDFALDTPKPGQAVYVFSTPGDFVKGGRKQGAVYTVWSDKNAISRFKAGDTVYLRAKVERIRPAEGDTPLHLVLTGEEAFASPGGAFNPTRPLLRTTGPLPEGALQLSDVVKQIRADAAGVQTRLKGKPMLYHGVVHQLSRLGKDYIISFYPNGKVESLVGQEPATVTVYIRGDIGGAVKGFKKGEPLRFKGTLTKAALETKEVDNFLDGGKKKEISLTLLLDGQTFILDENPI